MRGWTEARGGKQWEYTHHRIKGEQDTGVEEEGRFREGEGCSNRPFVLVGVTHKALVGAAELSYQTQRERKENVCKDWGMHTVQSNLVRLTAHPITPF